MSGEEYLGAGCEIINDVCDGATDSAAAEATEVMKAPRSSAEIGDFFA